MSLTKSLIGIGVFGIAGAISFFSLSPTYSPRASVDLQLTRTEIIEKSQMAFYYQGDDMRVKLTMKLIDKEGNKRRTCCSCKENPCRNLETS